MFALKSKTAAAALAVAVSLTVAACGSDEETPPGGSEAASPEPVVTIPAVDGEQTAVTFDPAFIQGITGLGLMPGVVGSATIDGAAGRVAFPITAGSITYFDPASGVTPYVQGELIHEGSGLSLNDGTTAVQLTEFVVDPEESVLTGRVIVNGEEFAPSAPLFILDGSTLNPLMVDEAEGTAVLEGTTVSLTAEAAEALNMVYGTDALTEGFLVGVAEITIAVPG